MGRSVSIAPIDRTANTPCVSRAVISAPERCHLHASRAHRARASTLGQLTARVLSIACCRKTLQLCRSFEDVRAEVIECGKFSLRGPKIACGSRNRDAGYHNGYVKTDINSG